MWGKEGPPEAAVALLAHSVESFLVVDECQGVKSLQPLGGGGGVLVGSSQASLGAFVL